MTAQVYACTHVGRVRTENQDSVHAAGAAGGGVLLMVADGMGGEAEGGLASRMAVSAAAAAVDAGLTPEQAVAQANDTILAHIAEFPFCEGMGTTATLALIEGDMVRIAHVGDSRAYLLRKGELHQLTRDHSFVQMLVDKGKMTREEARLSTYRNQITRAVGMEGLHVDTLTLPLMAGDTLLLCSDGLSMYYADAALAAALAQEGSAKERAERLLEGALLAGGADNISAAVAILREEAL